MSHRSTQDEVKRLARVRRQSLARLVSTTIISLALYALSARSSGWGLIAALSIFVVLWLGDVLVVIHTTRRIGKIPKELNSSGAESRNLHRPGELSSNSINRPDLADPILGSIRWSSEEDSWEARARFHQQLIIFEIAGDAQPDDELVGHARKIFQTFEDFKRMVAELLGAEAQKVKGRGGASQEIEALQVDRICLFRAQGRECGMIYFKGEDCCRVWRCDLVNGRPENLGFDS